MGKCVKSVFGEFSSDVSICPNKVLSQIWGPVFTRAFPSLGIQAWSSAGRQNPHLSPPGIWD